MSIHEKLAYYLRVAARYMGKPATMALRRKYFMPATYEALDQPWIKALCIATVLDIGANVGDFAFTIRPLLPDAEIYSFEPLPDCYTAMLDHLKGKAHFTAYNTALGDQTGELEFHRSSFSQSSSFLKMSASHQTAFPDSAESQPTMVQVERLDDVVQRISIHDPLLIKIDVQGYEDRVLRGGEQTVKRAKLLIIETAFEPLYDDQPLFMSIYQILTSWGFEYLGAVDQLHNPLNGRPIQQDSLFINRG